MKLFLASVLMLSATVFAEPVYFASPEGGANHAGAVYQVVGNQKSTIYDFCPEVGCRDGSSPLTNVINLEDGTLIGATSYGGVGYNGSSPAGVIFRLSPMADGSWAYEVLYDFCPWFADCTHYGFPSGGITLVNPNVIEGVIQTPDGEMGLHWRFKLLNSVGGSTWTALQHWESS